MAVYLITYDLNKPGQKYDDLYEVIKNLGTWWHYLDSTWLVDTTFNAKQIQEKMRAVLDRNDSFFIIKLTNENYQGWLSQDAWDWIHKHLGYTSY